MLLVIAAGFLFNEQEVCVGFGPLPLGALLTKHNTWKNSKMCLFFFFYFIFFELGG